MKYPFASAGGARVSIMAWKMLVAVLSCLVSTWAKDPTQFAPEHWLREEEESNPIPELGYGPTPSNIPQEFDCAWREYGALTRASVYIHHCRNIVYSMNMHITAPGNICMYPFLY